MRAVLAQTTMELRLALRRGEGLLVTLIIPVALLLFLASTNLFAASEGRPVDFLTPGILTLAIMSSGMVSLSIATAYERHYGVLKRLGGSPLSRPQLMSAKILALLVVQVVQVALVAGIAALVFGWRPVGIGPALLGGLLGTVAFASLGLAMAGSLRAEATLAIANGLYLAFLLVGGIFLPLAQLPAVVRAIAPYLPAAALTEVLRATLSGAAPPAGGLLVLTVWAAGAIAVAALTFRWE